MRKVGILFLCCALVLAAGGAARAALVVYEPFDYTVADWATPNGYWSTDEPPVALEGLTGQFGTGEVGLAGNNNDSGANTVSGWDRYSTADAAVASGSLSYAGADAGLPVGGNKAQTNTVGSHDRRMSAKVGDINGANTVYVSALMNPGATVNHFQQLDLRSYDGEGTDAGLFCWGGSGASYKILSPAAGGANSGVTAQADTTYLMVVKIEFTGDANADTATFWLDPVLTAGEGANTAVGSGTFTGGTYDSLVLYYYQDYGYYDEIKIGTTWDDLKLVPEPASLLLLGLGGVGLLLRRERTQ